MGGRGRGRVSGGLTRAARRARGKGEERTEALLAVLERLALALAVLPIEPLEQLPLPQHLLRRDPYVRLLALMTAIRLGEHDECVWEDGPVAFGPGCEEEGGGRGGLAEADGVDRRGDVSHRVEDGEDVGDGAAVAGARERSAEQVGRASVGLRGLPAGAGQGDRGRKEGSGSHLLMYIWIGFSAS